MVWYIKAFWHQANLNQETQSVVHHWPKLCWHQPELMKSSTKFWQTWKTTCSLLFYMLQMNSKQFTSSIVFAAKGTTAQPLRLKNSKPFSGAEVCWLLGKHRFQAAFFHGESLPQKNVKWWTHDNEWDMMQPKNLPRVILWHVFFLVHFCHWVEGNHIPSELVLGWSSTQKNVLYDFNFK